MENLIFQVRNPRMVGPGYSTIPIPETHNTSVAFGKGPEPNTAYILWEKKNWDSNDPDGIEPNPTKSDPKNQRSTNWSYEICQSSSMPRTITK